MELPTIIYNWIILFARNIIFELIMIFSFLSDGYLLRQNDHAVLLLVKNFQLFLRLIICLIQRMLELLLGTIATKDIGLQY